MEILSQSFPQPVDTRPRFRVIVWQGQTLRIVRWQPELLYQFRREPDELKELQFSIVGVADNVLCYPGEDGKLALSRIAATERNELLTLIREFNEV